MAEIRSDILTRDLIEIQAKQGNGTSVETSIGTFSVPFVYYDASLFALIYWVSPEKVQSLLGDLPLEPLVSFGKVAVILGVFEYRDSTLGRYCEISLGAQVKRKGSKPPKLRVIRKPASVENAGIFVFNLPLTREVPCVVGQELWGYPKYVTGIQTSFRDNQVDAELENEFSLSHRSGFGPTVKGVPFVTYTMQNRRLIRTAMDAKYRAKIGLGDRVQLKLLGQGPTATTVKALGLETMQPMLTLRTDSMQFELPEGKELATV